jgi:hypothetical protein
VPIPAKPLAETLPVLTPGEPALALPLPPEPLGPIAPELFVAMSPLIPAPLPIAAPLLPARLPLEAPDVADVSQMHCSQRVPSLAHCCAPRAVALQKHCSVDPGAHAWLLLCDPHSKQAIARLTAATEASFTWAASRWALRRASACRP